MPLTDHGVSLLRQVQQIITEHPQHFNMDRACGTACCIAGWIDALTGGPARTLSGVAVGPAVWNPIATRAAGALGFPYSLDSTCEIDFLFLDDLWPPDVLERFDDVRFEEARDLSALALVACERIDRFIAEHRPDLVGASR